MRTNKFNQYHVNILLDKMSGTLNFRMRTRPGRPQSVRVPCQRLCMDESKFFSLWALVFRNQTMANTLTLNCLVIPSAEPESVTRHSITTLKISTNETVDQLRPMIKERWPSLFENIFPTNFIFRKINSKVVITIFD